MISIDARGRVRAAHTIPLPLPASWVWGQMRDLPRFITWDPLHRRVWLENDQSWLQSGRSPVGTRMRIEHRLLGLGPDREGRILRWNEGSGYAFSDLSRRGRRVGFPHLCAYHIEPLDDARSRLTVSARGKWSARWIPHCVARIWLRWILVTTGIMIRAELRRLAMNVR